MARTRGSAIVGGLLAALLLSPSTAAAQVATTPERWLDGLEFPTNLAFAPDGRLFFTEKETGRVRIVRGGRLLSRPFIQLDVMPAAERGLLGIALDPSFADEPWVYLYLSDATDGLNRLVRVRAEGDRAAGSPEVLLELLPAAAGYHNGGDLAFRPDDGTLLVSVGEAHDPDRAQDPSDLGGKVLRIEPDGSVPPDGPLGPDNPVFTLGHRNSFGLCVDPERDVIWETENGPNVDDEVNQLAPGANYGWPAVTGAAADPRFTDPVAVFPDPVALTGCAVVAGSLFVGAFNTGELYRIVLPPPGQGMAPTTVAATFPTGITDVVLGPDGDLYVATADSIWRVAPMADEPSATDSGGATGTAAPSPGGGGPRSTPAWIPVAVAIVLAGGLLLRLVAGRRLRRAGGSEDRSG